MVKENYYYYFSPSSFGKSQFFFSLLHFWQLNCHHSFFFSPLPYGNSIALNSFFFSLLSFTILATPLPQFLFFFSLFFEHFSNLGSLDFGQEFR